jgi:hypothetical protein
VRDPSGREVEGDANSGAAHFMVVRDGEHEISWRPLSAPMGDDVTLTVRMALE